MFREFNSRASRIVFSLALTTLGAACDNPSTSGATEGSASDGYTNVYLQATDEKGNVSMEKVSVPNADVDKMLAARRSAARSQPVSTPTAKRLKMVGTTDWEGACQSWDYAVLYMEDHTDQNRSIYCVTDDNTTWTPRYIQMPDNHYVIRAWAGNSDVAICTAGSYSEGCYRNGVLLGGAVVDVVPAYEEHNIYNSAAKWASNKGDFDII